MRSELLQIFDIQLRDNVKAVGITVDGRNVPVGVDGKSEPVQSQVEIMKFLRDLQKKEVEV